MLEIIWIKLINNHHGYSIAGYFIIMKTCELISRKYYYPSLQYDIETYATGCNTCLTSKTIRYKLYGNLQSL